MKYEELTPDLQESINTVLKTYLENNGSTLYERLNESDLGDLSKFIRQCMCDILMSETANRIHTQGTLDIPDIRNKLGPLVTLINIIEGDHVKLDTSNEIIEILVGVLDQSKVSINYLSQRESMPLLDPSGTPQDYISINEHNRIVHECILQFEYLNGKFGEIGTTNAILAKLKSQQTK